MCENTVLYEVQGGVALVTLNRPQALNSFTRKMHHDLWAALDQAEADANIRALVITGAGRGFCAGADLSEFDFAEFPSPDGFQSADRLHLVKPDCICRPFQARLKVRFEGWPTRPDRSDFFAGSLFASQIRSNSSPIWHKTGQYWP